MNDKAPLYDDAYCLLKIKEGDEYFFNLIFEKYRHQFFNYLYRVTKSRETAEEIVLDVFLKLWHGRAAVTEIENLEAFLFRVAHNKAIDFFRTVKRTPKMQEEVWEHFNAVVSSDNADKKIIDKNFEELVHTAVDQLSPQRQKVYHLRNNYNLSYGEIAKKLDLSPHTVRNHLSASLQFIRDFLLKNDLVKLIVAFYFKIFF